MAPLQKRALYSFIIGIAIAAGLVAVFVAKGDVSRFDEDLQFRLVVYALWIGVPVVHLALMNFSIRKSGKIDERDRSILDKASKVQINAVLISIVVWVVVLTESYWTQGHVPIIYLTLVLISSLTISTLAQSFGILLGYWSMNRNG